MADDKRREREEREPRPGMAPAACRSVESGAERVTVDAEFDPTSAPTLAASGDRQSPVLELGDAAEEPVQPSFGVGSELCDGRFRVQRWLGEGGMGLVFEALDRKREQVVALKTITRLDALGIYRLKNEFRALTGVVHPGLVELYELFNDCGRWFFTMELVRGEPFCSHMRPGGVLLEARLRTALPHLVEAVIALHAAGKLHRDIKPTNVLVREDGRVAILDFGLASDFGSEASHARTLDEGVAGTPLYMAPEQASGEQPTEASDWYAVGAMIYETLVGEPPHAGPLHQVMVKKVATDPVPPRERNPAAPEDLSRLTMELLSRNAATRPLGADIALRLGARPPSLDPRPSLPPATVESSPATPFVGRERELGKLRGALVRVAEGQPVVVHVSGESGIGKSALVRRFLQEVASSDPLVLSSRCYERESVPYKAFDPVFDALSHHLKQLPAAEAAGVMPSDPEALCTLFPVLKRVEAVSGVLSRRPPPGDATELRRRGFAAVRELLTRLSHRRLLVIHIDDVQWGDADSALLLLDLLRLPDPPPALFIGSYRTQPPGSRIERLWRQIEEQRDPSGASVLVRAIALESLGEAESTRLAVQLAGGDLSSDATRAIVREAAGNPFLLGELALYGRDHIASALSLAARLDERLRALPDGARRLANVIAVASRPIPPEFATRAAGVERHGQELPRLMAERFIRSAPGRAERVECYHDRIRETLAALLSDVDRRAIHRLLADGFAAAERVDAERLSFHLLAAGDSARAAEYAAQAARTAHQALAFLDAARLYEVALAHGEHDPATRRELQCALGEAYSAAGRGQRGANAFLDAAAGAPEAVALKLRQRAAQLLLTSGHIDQGVDIIRGVLDRFGIDLPRDPRVSLARLLLRRTQLRLRGLGFVERAQGDVPEGELLQADACWSVAVGLSFVDPLRASEFQTRHVLLALRTGEPYRIACGLAMEAGFTAIPGRGAEQRAQMLCEMALTLAHRVDNAHAIGVATFVDGMRHFLVGRWRPCHDRMIEAEALLRAEPMATWELNSCQRILINAKTFMGDIPGIAERARELIAQARERGNLYAEVNMGVRLTSLVWLAKDDPDGGIEATRELMSRWSQEGFHLQHYNQLLALATYELYAGRVGDAWERIEQGWKPLAASMLLRTQALRAEVSFFRGRAALAAARTGDARALRVARRQLESLRREGLPWTAALADLLEASLCLQRGDAACALTLFERAEGGCTATDMQLSAAVAKYRRGQLLGGDRGAELVERASDWMIAAGVKNPGRMLRLYEPSLDGS